MSVPSYRCLGTIGEVEQAIKIHRSVVGAARILTDRELLATGLNNLGESLARSGQYNESITMIEEAYAIWEALGSDWGKSRVAHSHAEVLLAQGDAYAAGLHATRSLELARSLQDDTQVSYASTALAEALLVQGCFDQAFATIAPVCASPSPEYGYAALTVGGIVAYAIGRRAQARSWFESAVQEAETLLKQDDRLVAAQNCLVLARYGLARCRPGRKGLRALAAAQRAVHTSPERGMQFRLETMLGILMKTAADHRGTIVQEVYNVHVA